MYVEESVYLLEMVKCLFCEKGFLYKGRVLYGEKGFAKECPCNFCKDNRGEKVCNSCLSRKCSFEFSRNLIEGYSPLEEDLHKNCPVSVLAIVSLFWLLSEVLSDLSNSRYISAHHVETAISYVHGNVDETLALLYAWTFNKSPNAKVEYDFLKVVADACIQHPSNFRCSEGLVYSRLNVEDPNAQIFCNSDNEYSSEFSESDLY